MMQNINQIPSLLSKQAYGIYKNIKEY